MLRAIEGLAGTLTLVIALVAGLGVLNTVVLQTRERVHDLGAFKAVGMTPRQTITMVVSTVAGTGLVAGLASIPAGVTLHRDVLPVMGHAVQTALPVAVLDVYQAPELVLLALSGLAIAVAGARPGRLGGPRPHRRRAARRVALQCLARLAGPATGARSGKEFSRPVSIPGLPVRSTSDGGRNGRPPEQLKEMQCGRSSRD